MLCNLCQHVLNEFNVHIMNKKKEKNITCNHSIKKQIFEGKKHILKIIRFGFILEMCATDLIIFGTRKYRIRVRCDAKSFYNENKIRQNVNFKNIKSYYIMGTEGKSTDTFVRV